MINNSAVIQSFGINNHLMAQEWGDIFGREPKEMLKMRPEDAVLNLHGRGSLICCRPDYLRDKIFAGMFDENERFALHGGL